MDWEQVRARFKQVWGYDDFRPPQGEVIANLLAGQDSLVVLATGSGKSICFQLPAILRSGLTVVVSPLLSLIEDQVQDLRGRNLAVAALHSNLSQGERRQVLGAFSRLQLLYVSPETLFSKPVWERLIAPDIKVVGLMVDEAHCVSQWGDSFRPDYRRLGAVRRALQKPDHPKLAIAAFTATADPRTQADLKSCLQLQQPQLIRTSPYRSHLSLNVAIAWTMAGRREQTLRFIQNYRGKSGLIYMRSRRESEALAAWLRSQDYDTCAYHGGLPSGERRTIERQWQSGAIPFVVATSAFGLGVNKPDVRFVLHFQAPLTLAEYIQEVGRAGRDGKYAKALMFISSGVLDDSDRRRQEFFLQEQQKQHQAARLLIPKLPKQGQYGEVVKNFPNAAIALGLLHSSGLLRWHSPFEYEISKGDLPMPAYDRQLWQQMQAYNQTRGCRWAFLMGAFGFESSRLHCGICDRCLKK